MKTLILLLCAVTLISCNKKDDDDDAVVVVAGGVTSAELVGTSSVCRSGGSTFDGVPSVGVANSSYLETIRFNADETFSYDQYWFTGTVCQLGGTSLFAYSYEGTFALGGLTAEGSTKIVMTITDSMMSVYPGAAPGAYFKTEFESGSCANAMVFTANWDVTITTTTCGNPTHNWALATFATHVPVYNVLTLDTASNVLSLGANSAQWYVGNTMATYPTTVPHVFSSYQ